MRIPSEKSDKLSSVTPVTLANQRSGRRKSYIKAESVACQFCRNCAKPLTRITDRSIVYTSYMHILYTSNMLTHCNELSD